MKKITIIILMISIIVTILGGCNPSPSGTEVSSFPVASTPEKPPMITPSIVPSETPSSPSLTPEPSSDMPTVLVWAKTPTFTEENITLEEAMKFITVASYIYPDGYIRYESNRYEDYDFLGAVDGTPVYDAKVIDDGYSEKGFDIFKEYYRCFYTAECIEKAMLLNGKVNINGVICEFYADMHGLRVPLVESKGKMIVDEPDRKIVEVQVFETVSFSQEGSKYANYTLTRTENHGSYVWRISDIDLTPSFGTDEVIKVIFTEEEKRLFKEQFLISEKYGNGEISWEEYEVARAEMTEIIANAKNQEII